MLSSRRRKIITSLTSSWHVVNTQPNGSMSKIMSNLNLGSIMVQLFLLVAKISPFLSKLDSNIVPRILFSWSGGAGGEIESKRMMSRMILETQV